MIRKTTPKLFLAIGALTLWAGMASAELMQVVGVADGDTLNVRSGPGAKFADIGDIARGGAVNVLGYNTAGTWAKIQYRGQIGWVSAKYLTTGMRSDGTALATGPHVVTGIKATDPDGGLVVRTGAGSSFAAMGVLRNDTAVHVIQRNGNWAMIAVEGGVGWVNAAYLTRQQNTAGESGGGSSADGFPLGITCNGTEPFWTLSIAQNRAVQYISPDEGTAPGTYLVLSTATNGGYPYSFDASPYSGTIYSQACSDGMSDTNYPLAITLFKPSANGGMQTLQGCCTLP